MLLGLGPEARRRGAAIVADQRALLTDQREIVCQQRELIENQLAQLRRQLRTTRDPRDHAGAVPRDADNPRDRIGCSR